MIKKYLTIAILSGLIGASGPTIAHSQEEMELEETAGKLQRKLSLNPDLIGTLLDVKIVDGKMVIVGQVSKTEDFAVINRIVNEMGLEESEIQNDVAQI